VVRDRVPKVDQGTGGAPVPAANVISLPIDQIGKSAVGIGHLNANVDVGWWHTHGTAGAAVFRPVLPLYVDDAGGKKPHLGPEDIKVTLGEGVQIAS